MVFSGIEWVFDSLLKAFIFSIFSIEILFNSEMSLKYVWSIPSDTSIIKQSIDDKISAAKDYILFYWHSIDLISFLLFLIFCQLMDPLIRGNCFVVDLWFKYLGTKYLLSLCDHMIWKFHWILFLIWILINSVFNRKSDIVARDSHIVASDSHSPQLLSPEMDSTHTSNNINNNNNHINQSNGVVCEGWLTKSPPEKIWKTVSHLILDYCLPFDHVYHLTMFTMFTIWPCLPL